MLTLNTLKENYIDIILNKTGLPFSVYTDAGDFEKAIRNYNSVTEYINGLFTVSGSNVEFTGDGGEMVSLTTELKFILRLNDVTDENGEFPNIAQFREALSQAFSSVSPRFNITEEGKTYSVVAAYSFPATGVREQRSTLGDSITFSCTVFFAYLSNALNASDVKITLDGETIPFLEFNIARRPSIVASQYSDSVNTEGKAYAESAAFTIDLSLPAFITKLGGACADYILGLEDANALHTVVLDFGDKTITKEMVFGESHAVGQGVENVRYNVSLVPYAGEAIAEG